MIIKVVLIHDNVELELLHKRIDTLKKWIASRPENHIAVVSHSSFLGEMLFGKNRR